MKIKNKWIIITLISIYILANLIPLISNIFIYDSFEDITKNETILVIVAHQDDATIIAGGAMIKTLKKGGKVHVIYTVDGITRGDPLTQEDIQKLILGRENEAYNALNSIGVPRENIYFLRNENEKGLMNLTNIQKTITQISDKILQIKPDRIFIPAYEGGHCDHDMTNYIVAKATNEINFSRDNILEASEYNRYYLSESILNRINKLLLIKFILPPKFLPGTTETINLDLTNEELTKKINMLRYFKSQNYNDELVYRFGFTDRYRILEDYSYSEGPFLPSKELRYNLCLLTKKEDKCSPFYCNMNLQDYQTLYGNLENENSNISSKP